MPKMLMLIAAAICGLSLTVVAQTPAPAAADQKPAAEQKMEKKAEGKKAAKKGGKKASKKAEGKKEAKAEKKADAPATK